MYGTGVIDSILEAEKTWQTVLVAIARDAVTNSIDLSRINQLG